MILVTGGAGYIGSHTVLSLKEKGEEVIVFDNFCKGHRDLVFGDHLVEGDLNDLACLSELFRRWPITQVVHFAAFSLVGESADNPQKYYQNNVNGTLNLLSAMKDAHVKDLVFSSTAAVYGQVEQMPITEDCPLRPSNVYGKTKRVIEDLLDDWCRAYGLRAVTLRYFNAAGADPQCRTGEDHRPETHLIPLVLDVALGRQKEVTVFGRDYSTPDGTCLRDYIHVCDLAEAHVLSLKRLSNEAEGFRMALNLGTGKGYSVLQICEAARQITEREITIQSGPRRVGDPAVLVASSEKARNELGWQPQFDSVQHIVATAWQWHQKRFV